MYLQALVTPVWRWYPLTTRRETSFGSTKRNTAIRIQKLLNGCYLIQGGLMSDSETGYVYTLNDPRTGEPKYVGATKNPSSRLNSHKSGATNQDVTDWIDELETEGHEPEMMIVSVGELSKLGEKESRIIDRMAKEWQLLNRQSSSGYSARSGGGGGNNTITRVPDAVLDKAEDVQTEHDYPTIGEAIRHMVREGGYNV